MDEVPFEDRDVPLVEIDWERSLWWMYPLLQAPVRVFYVSTLLTGWIALALASWGLRLGERLFAPAWRAAADAGASVPVPPPWPTISVVGGLPFESLGWRELAYVSFALIWLTLVFGLLGGMVARSAMVGLGQRTNAPWGESFVVAMARLPSIFGVTFATLATIVIMLAPIMLLGWIDRLGGVAAAISGTLIVIVVPMMLTFGRGVFSLIACFPMAVCAIVAERKPDGFEGISRSQAYVFQRPMLAVVFAIALAVIGLIGWWVAYALAAAGWWTLRGVFQSAAGLDGAAIAPYVATADRFASELIRAYGFSYFWVASAVLYLFMRRAVDGVEPDELDDAESAIELELPSIPNAPGQSD